MGHRRHRLGGGWRGQAGRAVKLSSNGELPRPAPFRIILIAPVPGPFSEFEAMWQIMPLGRPKTA
jgi:hypothetical protein